LRGSWVVTVAKVAPLEPIEAAVAGFDLALATGAAETLPAANKVTAMAAEDIRRRMFGPNMEKLSGPLSRRRKPTPFVPMPRVKFQQCFSH
jgi:hypothetical protein